MVKDHDDDEIIPIISGRMPSLEAPESLPKPKVMMGGKTIGEELGERSASGCSKCFTPQSSISVVLTDCGTSHHTLLA